jgi:Amt family ammonium transporter
VDGLVRVQRRLDDRCHRRRRGDLRQAFALIAVNTNLAACAGALVAMIIAWAKAGKPDIGMTLNGALAGLVAITAPCANVTPVSAILIGAVGGALVYAAINFFERAKVDDPVGAVSVHGVNGAWGTLAAALFHHGGFSWGQLATQAIGVVVAFVCGRSASRSCCSSCSRRRSACA